MRAADGALLVTRGQVVSGSLVERVRNLYHIAAAFQRVRVIAPVRPGPAVAVH